jgi:hypothetical protein
MKSKKIKKSSVIIISVLLFLAVMTAVLAALNYNGAQERAQRQHDATFVITAGEQSYIIDLDIMREVGIRDFTAERRSGGNPAVTVNYQGVPLKDLCDKLGIKLSDFSGFNNFDSCVAFAADGYTVAVAMDKVSDPENVFIATGENGELLKKMEDGGDGPYMMVIVKDPFSQFWCKYLSEIVFK